MHRLLVCKDPMPPRDSMAAKCFPLLATVSPGGSPQAHVPRSAGHEQ